MGCFFAKDGLTGGRLHLGRKAQIDQQQSKIQKALVRVVSAQEKPRQEDCESLSW
jgi:hypothetical protein